MLSPERRVFILSKDQQAWIRLSCSQAPGHLLIQIVGFLQLARYVEVISFKNSLVLVWIERLLEQWCAWHKAWRAIRNYEAHVECSMKFLIEHENTTRATTSTEFFKLQSWTNRSWTNQFNPTKMGFEPTRAMHNGLAVHHLNLSVTSSHMLL